MNKNEPVIAREENFPESHWLLERVIETYPGKDSVVCSVKIKLSISVLTRSCNKLCLLEDGD